jgi:hypothetical protein
MAVTTSTFLARFSEFQPQPTITVQACLEQADRETDVDTWGDLHDDATYWLTAHLLALRIREVGMFTGATPAKQYLSGGSREAVDIPFTSYGLTATLYGQEFMRLEQSRVYSTIGFVV